MARDEFTYRVLEVAGPRGIEIDGKTFKAGQEFVSTPVKVAAVRALIEKLALQVEVVPAGEDVDPKATV